jgi:hypothetical protein
MAKKSRDDPGRHPQEDLLDAGLHAAVATFAEAMGLPFSGPDRLPAMMCLLRHLAGRVRQAGAFERSMLTEDFADELLRLMDSTPEGAPAGTKGVVAPTLRRHEDLVAIVYSETCLAGFTPEGARHMAEGLLTIAGEIDGKIAYVTYLSMTGRAG